MATEINCFSTFEHPLVDVFDTGTQVAMLPTDIEGFHLKVAGERFAPEIGVHVGVSALNGLVNSTLKGEVVEFIPNQRVLIRATKSLFATAEVSLELSQDKKKGLTRVDYGIEVVHHGLVSRRLEGKLRPVLEERVELFAAGYTDNVTNFLNNRAAKTRAPRKKAA